MDEILNVIFKDTVNSIEVKVMGEGTQMKSVKMEATPAIKGDAPTTLALHFATKFIEDLIK